MGDCSGPSPVGSLLAGSRGAAPLSPGPRVLPSCSPVGPAESHTSGRCPGAELGGPRAQHAGRRLAGIPWKRLGAGPRVVPVEEPAGAGKGCCVCNDGFSQFPPLLGNSTEHRRGPPCLREPGLSAFLSGQSLHEVDHVSILTLESDTKPSISPGHCFPRPWEARPGPGQGLGIPGELAGGC